MFKESLLSEGLEGFPDRVYIVYPHKIKNTFNNLHNVVVKVEALLRRDFPSVDFKILRSMYESKPTSRGFDAGNQQRKLISGLMQRQVFGYQENVDPFRVDFLQDGFDAVPYFLIFDDQCDTGVTFAEWSSFIKSRGGRVLGFMSQYSLFSYPLAQGCFKGVSHELRIKNAFSIALDNSSSCELDADVLIDRFDRALKESGNEISALTYGECEGIISDLLGNQKSCLAIALNQSEKPSPK